jgi:SRSO17 transposase
MLDEMIEQWGLPNLPVAADSGYGDCTLFRLGLTERGLRYAVQVDPTATAHPATAGSRSPRPTPAAAGYPTRPTPTRRPRSRASSWPLAGAPHDR